MSGPGTKAKTTARNRNERSAEEHEADVASDDEALRQEAADHESGREDDGWVWVKDHWEEKR